MCSGLTPIFLIFLFESIAESIFESKLEVSISFIFKIFIGGSPMN